MAKFRRIGWRLAGCAALLIVLLYPGPAATARPAHAANGYALSMSVVIKPDHLCINSRTTIAFAVTFSTQDPAGLASLVPLPPVELNAIPTLGSVTPGHWSFPASDGTYFFTFDYVAKQAGHDPIDFVARVGSDSFALPPVAIEVYKCQYHVTLNGTRTADVVPLGAGTGQSVNFYSGEGHFDLLVDKYARSKGDILIAGSGTAKIDLMVSMKTPNGGCLSKPNQAGAAHYVIYGFVSADNNLQLDFLFDTAVVSGGVSNCTVQGKPVSKPMVAAPYTMQTKNLMGITFSPSGGQKEFNGQVTDTPPANTTLTENVYVSVREGSK